MKSTITKSSKILFDFFTNRLYFCAIYFVVMVLRSFPSIMSAVDLLVKLCFLWGIGLLAWDLFTRRTMFRGYKSVVLVLFMLSYGITILSNPTLLYDEIKYFIYNGILLFLFYPGDEEVPVERKAKVFVIVNDIFTLLCFVASCISIVMFLFQISYSVQIDSVVYGQGVAYNRLYGVYVSANPGALASVCTIFMTLITYQLNKKHFRRFRVCYLINGIIQFVYFTLTLSNGGYLAWIVGLVMLAVCFFFPLCKKRCQTILSLLLTAIVIAVSFVGFTGAVTASRTVMTFLANTIQSSMSTDPPDMPNTSDTPNSPSTGKQPDQIVIERVEDGTDLSNGRLTIWGAAFAAWKQKPLFGWGDCRFFDGDEVRIPIDVSKLSSSQINELKRAQGYMHNAFVQIAVCSGAIGLVIFAVFAVFVGAKYIRSLLQYHKRPSYSLLAAIFVFIVLLLSQQLAESHLLFTRQDAFSYLFWLYLGFGMQLIKHEKQKQATDFAFMCDTPLQVLNAVSFVESDAEGCKGRSDLFLYHQFRGSEELSARLKEAGVFRNVYDFSKIREQSGAVSKLSTCLRLLFPQYTIKKLCRGDRGYVKNHYGTIVLSFYTPFSDILRLAVGTTRTIQFEDGLGSYVTDDLESHYRSGVFDFVNKFIVNGALSYHPQALYLNNPALCANSVLPVQKLSGIADDPDVADTVKRIYGFKSSMYADQRIVYLTQPFGPSEGGERVINEERQMLPLLKQADPVVRVHPRQSSETFEGFMLDTVGNMWELECAQSIGDAHVLIGAFSTAQFTPKMMFDREPTLVFLYKLYGCQFNNADELVERIRASYRDPQKVLVPKTKEEFNAILATV